MIYSLYDPAKKAYDYFESPAKDADIDNPSPHIRPTSQLGSPVDVAAWTIPSGARPIGSGTTARGMVAYRKPNLGLAGLDDLLRSPSARVAVTFVAGVFFGRYLAKRGSAW